MIFGHFTWVVVVILDESLLVHEADREPPHKIDENMWKNREHMEETLFLLETSNWPAVVRYISLLWQYFILHPMCLFYCLEHIFILRFWSDCSFSSSPHRMMLSLRLFSVSSKIKFKTLWRFWSFSNIRILIVCSILVTFSLSLSLHLSSTLLSVGYVSYFYLLILWGSFGIICFSSSTRHYF